MKKTYKAFVVFSGSGDDYQLHAVSTTEEGAQHCVDNNGVYGYAPSRDMRVRERTLGSKRELENLMDEELTDEQADEYAVAPEGWNRIKAGSEQE